MSKMLIWNAVSTRRRAATDNILENGLAQLKGAAQDGGHEVILADWARDGFHQGLAPRWLTRFCRNRLAKAMQAGDSGARARAKFQWLCSLPAQSLQTAIRRRRMRAELKNLARCVAGRDIKLVGMKLWYGEALEWAETLMRYIRRLDSEVLFVAGGPLVSIYGQHLMAQSEFDIAVVAQGEEALAVILDAATAHKHDWSRKRVSADLSRLAAVGYLGNVIYRDGDGVVSSRRSSLDVSAGVMPSYSDKDTVGKCKMHVVKSSLGCSWGKCHFCVHPRIYPEFHSRSLEEIVAEIKSVLARGVGFFRFAGSDTPPAFGAEIARRLMGEGIQIEFGMGLRGVQGIRDPRVYERTVGEFEQLIQGGLRAVIMGGETGHPEINEKVMNKGLHPEEVVTTIRAIREAGRTARIHVDVALALIHPTPLIGEVTLEEVYAATVSMIERAKPDAVAVNPPAPFPGTEWERARDRFGFDISEDCVERGMRYEFVPYKPPERWPDIGVGLNGWSWTQMLQECRKLRQEVERMGLPTDLTDEHFALMRASGESDVRLFKRETLLDTLSGNYEYLEACYEKVNRRSEGRARENLRRNIARICARTQPDRRESRDAAPALAGR